MSAPPEPLLAPPGAGLPASELIAVRMLFALRRWTGNRQSFDARFRKERDLIRSLTRSCDPETGARRVLIRRLPGLEDSSRNWSVWMTLDHLRIVHRSLIGVIGALTQEKVPGGKASTATVKPSPDATAAVVPGYEESCDTLLQLVAGVSDLKTKARYEHPWFGPLDAAGWHALAGMHMGIHRAQIERILADGKGPPLSGSNEVKPAA